MRSSLGGSLRRYTGRTGILVLAVLLVASCSSSGGGKKKKKSANNAPAASAEADIVTLVGRAVTISGSASDEDDDKLTYSWTQASGPEVDLGGADAASISFTVTQAGTYEFELVANDGKDDSDPATQSVLVHDIDGGDAFTVALKPDGTLWAWGDNSYGQLSRSPDLSSSTTPLRICDQNQTDCDAHPLTNVVAVSAGRAHVLALKSDGTVWAWGDNMSSTSTDTGQLGNGDDGGTPVTTPHPVCSVGATPPCTVANGRILKKVMAISAGYDFSTALLSNGTVVTWGENAHAELGNGDRAALAPSSVPVKVCAVGQLENDCTDFLSGVTRLASGGGGHTLALLEGGTIAAWGENKNGQVGNGESATAGDVARVIVPEAVCNSSDDDGCGSVLGDVVAVDAWSALALALKSDGTLFSWGHNELGQLGWDIADSADVNCFNSWCKSVPVQVCANGTLPCTEHFTNVESIAASRRFALALKDDHSVWAWGYNTDGELGAVEVSGICNVDYGTPDVPCTPIPVQVCASGNDPCTKPLDGISAIAAGTFHSFALGEDGTLWTWGLNDNGQLGIGSTATKTKPVKVSDY